MTKFKVFILGFSVGGLIISGLCFLNFILNVQNQSNTYSDHHLTCQYSKNNSNVLICKINEAKHE